MLGGTHTGQSLLHMGILFLESLHIMKSTDVVVCRFGPQTSEPNKTWSRRETLQRVKNQNFQFGAENDKSHFLELRRTFRYDQSTILVRFRWSTLLVLNLQIFKSLGTEPMHMDSHLYILKKIMGVSHHLQSST